MLPARTRRTQYGALTFGPWILMESASVLVRASRRVPLLGETAIVAQADPAASVWRNMIPALAQELVSVWLTTRAMIEPSPFRGWDTNWNSSAAPHISLPEPL